jgi:hypothetical protein
VKQKCLKKTQTSYPVRWIRHRLFNNRHRSSRAQSNVLFLQQSRKHLDPSASQKRQRQKHKATNKSLEGGDLMAQQKLGVRVHRQVNNRVISAGEVLKKLQDELRED